MNGTMLKEKLPKFVDLNNLPIGYYDEVNPHTKRIPCKINIQELSRYIRDNNCSLADITETEAKQFMK